MAFICCRSRLISTTTSTFSRRNGSTWSSKHARFPSFFNSTPVPRFSLSRKALWLIPISGGIALYFAPRKPHSIVPAIISSPSIIPCPPSTERCTQEHIILSPAEEELTWNSRIATLLRDRIWEPILTAKRLVHLLYLFVPVILTSPMLLVGKPRKRYNGQGWGAIWWYDFLVSRMQTAGPTFIKLAQWAASRADLFPSALCERMGALHSRGKPHSLEHTKKVIAKVFQRPFDQVFEYFDETPIGTGAIAQVYRAVLKQDLIPPSYLGPRRHRKSPAAAISPVILDDPPPSIPTAAVAIKVIHPRAYKTIARDLCIMSGFAHFITMFPGMQWLSLPEEVEVFGDMMFQQLDLRNEADNLITFEHNFASRKVPVTFPRPLKEFTTKELLVEEYENALPLENVLKYGGGPFDQQIATVGLNAFLNMLLLDNFVHSDLHPGNIMIKFTKPPSTSYLLKNLWLTIKHSFTSNSDSEAPAFVLPPDYSESDSIVERLMQIPGENVDAWERELTSLHSAGYIPELIFIDAGLVTTLSATNRTNFLDLFKSLAEFDGYRTGQLMIERCRTPELATDPETFALKMQHLVLSVKRKTFSLGHIKISDILQQVLLAVRQHHVKMEGDFINTVISVLLLEGIGRRLDPELDLFKSALPILRQLGGQMAKREQMKDLQALPKSNLGAILKIWVWMEARQFISASIVNADEMIRYDWLAPNV